MGKNRKRLRELSIQDIRERTAVQDAHYRDVMQFVMNMTGTNQAIVQENVYRDMGVKLHNLPDLLLRTAHHHIALAQRYHRIQMRLIDITAQISGAAHCGDSPETRRTMRRASDDLLAAISHFRDELAILGNDPAIQPDRDRISQIVEYCMTISRKAALYYKIEPVSGSATYQQQRRAAKAALDELRVFIIENDPRFRRMVEQSATFTENRGRPTNMAKLAIGRIATKQTGPAWQIGQRIYQNLLNIDPDMRSDEQKEMIRELNRFFFPATAEVSPDQKAALGQYIRDRKKKFSGKS